MKHNPRVCTKAMKTMKDLIFDISLALPPPSLHENVLIFIYVFF